MVEISMDVCDRAVIINEINNIESMIKNQCIYFSYYLIVFLNLIDFKHIVYTTSDVNEFDLFLCSKP